MIYKSRKILILNTDKTLSGTRSVMAELRQSEALDYSTCEPPPNPPFSQVDENERVLSNLCKG